MSIADIILLLIIGAAVFIAFRFMIGRKKKNRCSGCSNCSGCSGCDNISCSDTDHDKPKNR